MVYTIGFLFGQVVKPGLLIQSNQAILANT